MIESDSNTPPAVEPPLVWWKRTWVRDIAKVIISALVIFLVISNTLETVRVDGTSMVGTLQNGNLLLASKVSYDFGINPARGDIVILIPPVASTNDYIKRVIGMPGDVIEINGEKNPTQLLIKPGGKGPFLALKEPYLPQTWTGNKECCNAFGMASLTPTPYTIPQGSYFVMGDNRNYSMDSRSFGVVPRKNILAKVFVRIWPFSQLGGLGAGPSLGAITLAGSGFPALVLLGLEAWRRNRARKGGAAGLGGARGKGWFYQKENPLASSI